MSNSASELELINSSYILTDFIGIKYFANIDKCKAFGNIPQCLNPRQCVCMCVHSLIDIDIFCY